MKRLLAKIADDLFGALALLAIVGAFIWGVRGWAIAITAVP